MPTIRQGSIRYSDRYNADDACKHCGGIIRHEPWCVTCNRRVLEAYEIVLDPAKISLQDELILHALGVIWNNESPRLIPRR